jgi:hypothetical protein
MAQSNYNIPNDSAPAVRAQLNSVFQSIATNNSGTAAPSTTFPHQWWYDTTTNILKQRNAADSDWIDIGTFDQSAGTFSPAGVAQLTQGQAEDPASTVFGRVSGQRLAQSSDVRNISSQQSWQDVASIRSGGTLYQNTTGRPIVVLIRGDQSEIDVSADGTNFVEIGFTVDKSGDRRHITFVVPNGHYYRVRNSSFSIGNWVELR